MMKLSDLDKALKLKDEIVAYRAELHKCMAPFQRRYFTFSDRGETQLIEIRQDTSLADECDAFSEVQEAMRKLLQGRIDKRLDALKDLGISADD